MGYSIVLSYVNTSSSIESYVSKEDTPLSNINISINSDNFKKLQDDIFILWLRI